jgi:hypothetical protein
MSLGKFARYERGGLVELVRDECLSGFLLNDAVRVSWL